MLSHLLCTFTFKIYHDLGEKVLSLMVKLFFSNVILNLAEFLHPKALQSDHIAWNLKHMGAAVSKNKPLDCA